MSDLAIELHDVGLRVLPAEPTDREIEPDPGIALLDGDRLHVGRVAEARARLRPKQTHRHFWHAPSTAPLSASFPAGWTLADLAHAHLEALWNRVSSGVDRVVVAAPGSWTAEELGLTLGIARALDMPVVGVVDSALGAVIGAGLDHGVETTSRVVHLDVYQHRAVATHLEYREGAWVRVRVDDVETVGYASLLDRWARAANAAFVRVSRFEPFHAPETEQDLYDRLPGWLAALDEHSAIEVALDAPSGPVHVELDRAALLDPVRDAYRELDALVPSRPGATLLLSASAASLPGWTDRLRRAGHEVHRLPVDAATRGALATVDALIQDDGALRFVLRLDAEPPTVPDVEPDPEPEAKPEPLRLSIEGRGERLVVTALDGVVRRGDQLLAAGATLRVGDRLVLPSGLALRVEPSALGDAPSEDVDGA